MLPIIAGLGVAAFNAVRAIKVARMVSSVGRFALNKVVKPGAKLAWAGTKVVARNAGKAAVVAGKAIKSGAKKIGSAVKNTFRKDRQNDNQGDNSGSRDPTPSGGSEGRTESLSTDQINELILNFFRDQQSNSSEDTSLDDQRRSTRDRQIEIIEALVRARSSGADNSSIAPFIRELEAIRQQNARLEIQIERARQRKLEEEAKRSAEAKSTWKKMLGLLGKVQSSVVSGANKAVTGGGKIIDALAIGAVAYKILDKYFPNITGAVEKFATSAMNMLGEVFGGINFSEMYNEIVAKASSMMQGVTDWWENLKQAPDQIISSIVSSLESTVGFIKGMFENFDLKKIYDEISAWFGDVMGGIANWWNSTDLGKKANEILDAWKNFSFSDWWDSLVDTMGFNKIRDWWDEFSKKWSEFDMGEWLASFTEGFGMGDVAVWWENYKKRWEETWWWQGAKEWRDELTDIISRGVATWKDVVMEWFRQTPLGSFFLGKKETEEEKAARIKEENLRTERDRIVREAEKAEKKRKEEEEKLQKVRDLYKSEDEKLQGITQINNQLMTHPGITSDIASKPIPVITSPIASSIIKSPVPLKTPGASVTTSSRSEDENRNKLFGDKEFMTSLFAFAKERDIDPMNILRMMKYESGGYKTNVTNAQGFKGLFQIGAGSFSDPTLGKKLGDAGFNYDTFQDESAARQMQAYQIYYDEWQKRTKGNKIDTLGEISALQLAPSKIKDPSGKLYAAGTDAYNDNKGLDSNKDGIITSEEYAKKMIDRFGNDEFVAQNAFSNHGLLGKDPIAPVEKQSSDFNYSSLEDYMNSGLGGGRMGDKFGPRNVEGGSKNHKGIDFRPLTPGGTARILPFGPGVVVEAKHSSSFGNYVLIKHPSGKFTRYAHLDSLEVKAGDQVSNNTLLGMMGNTGRSFGNHLHFEMLDENKKQVDPEKMLAGAPVKSDNVATQPKTPEDWKFRRVDDEQEKIAYEESLGGGIPNSAADVTKTPEDWKFKRTDSPSSPQLDGVTGSVMNGIVTSLGEISTGGNVTSLTKDLDDLMTTLGGIDNLTNITSEIQGNLSEELSKDTAAEKVTPPPPALQGTIPISHVKSSNADSSFGGQTGVSAPLVTRNTDSSIRRLTDQQLSYGIA